MMLAVVDLAAFFGVAGGEAGIDSGSHAVAFAKRRRIFSAATLGGSGRLLGCARGCERRIWISKWLDGQFVGPTVGLIW